MKPLFTIILLFALTASFGQTKIFSVAKCHAVIEGKIKNNISTSLDYQITDYFNDQLLSIPIDSNGSFFTAIAFDGTVQDMYLGIDNTLIVDVKDRDTIKLEWDAKDVNRTIKISSSNLVRNEELQNLLKLHKLYRGKYMSLTQALWGMPSDSAKYRQINALYNEEIRSIGNEIKPKGSKLSDDVYFMYTHLLFYHHLLPAYELKIEDTTLQRYTFGYPLIKQKNYTLQSEKALVNNPSYRHFVFDYLRSYRPLEQWEFGGEPSERAERYTGFTPSWDNYHAAQAYLKLVHLRDWFVTKLIINDFRTYSFPEVEGVYKDFAKKVKVPAYADTLAMVYKNAQMLKPGNPAPDFTLRNDKGKMISLHDLRGKIVFIDFWGVSCKPCLYDIRNFVPKLHERYLGKDVVFLNICVDTKAEIWKKNLADLKMDGVNLLAEGWTRNPVCIKYNVTVIPHYYIIDADGKIADSNAPSPSEGEMLSAKIDKLLSK